MKGSIATVVRSFKAAPTKATNHAMGAAGTSLWQRGIYEHVVRGDEDLARLRRYIDENPLRWALEEENPAEGST